MTKRVGVVGTGSNMVLAVINAVNQKQVALSGAYEELKLWNEMKRRDTVPFSYFENRVRSINKGTHLDYINSIKYVVAEEKKYTYVNENGCQ